MDICGPFRVPSVGGARYWLLLVDDHCRYVVLRPMKDKSDAPAMFKSFKAEAELHFKREGHVIQHVRVDGGGEFNSDMFKAYLKELGIVHQVTSAHTSEQNGIVERKHRVVAEHMRSMMLAWGPEHNVPTALWAEAATTSAYLLNRCTTSALLDKTPYEAWHGVKPTYMHLRTFGCLAYAHTHQATRDKKGGLGKLGAQATRCAMLGYAETSKAYRLWDFQKKKVVISFHVAFEERVPAFPTVSTAANAASIAAWEDVLPPVLAADLSDADDDDAVMPPLIPPPGPTSVIQLPATVPPSHAVPVPTFLKQMIEEMKRQDSMSPPSPAAMSATPSTAVIPDDPKTYEEAMKSEEAPFWIAAMQAEIQSQELADAFDVVDLPDGMYAIGGKWVYRTKRGPIGEIIKYKARWCAQGFSQKRGIDYNETFAPCGPLRLHPRTAVAGGPPRLGATPDGRSLRVPQWRVGGGGVHEAAHWLRQARHRAPGVSTQQEPVRPEAGWSHLEQAHRCGAQGHRLCPHPC